MAKLILEIDGKDAEAVAKAVGAAVEKAGGKVKVLSEEEKKLAQSFKSTTEQMSRQNAGLATILEKVKRKELSVRALATAERVAAAAAQHHVDVMSKEGRELARLIEDHDRLQKELRETAAGLDRVDDEAQGASGSFGRMAAGALALAAALGLKEALFGIAEIAGRYESLRTQLQTVVGSAEGAGRAFQQLTSFATRTPFEVENLTTAFIRLKAVGIEPTESVLTAFGDTAAAFGRDITDYAQAVIGATTGEMEMLKAFGITAKVEGDKVTFLYKKVATEVSRDSDSIVAYLKKLGETNFAGGMERQAATMQGAISNVKDAWAGFADLVGQSGLTEAISAVARDFSALLTSGDGQATAVQLGHDLADVVRALAKVIPPAVQAMATMASHVDDLAAALVALTAMSVASWLLGVVKAAEAAAVAAGSAAKGFAALRLATVSFLANPVTLAIAALGGIVFGLVKFVQWAGEAQKAQRDYADALNTTIPNSEQYNKLVDQGAKAHLKAALAARQRLMAELELAEQLQDSINSRTLGVKERGDPNFRRLEEQSKSKADQIREGLERNKNQIVALWEEIRQVALNPIDWSGGGGTPATGGADVVSKLREQNEELAIKIRQTGEEIRATTESAEAVRQLKIAHEAENAIRAAGATLTALEIRQIQAGIPLRDRLKQGIVDQTLALSDLNQELDKEQARLAAKGKARELFLKVNVDTTSLDKVIAERNKKAVEFDMANRNAVFEWQQRNQKVYDEQRAQADAQLEDAAQYFRDSLVTPREEFERLNRLIDQLAKTADAAGNPLLSAAEAERLRARAAADFAAQTLSNAEQVFGQLADMFGGFFSYLHRAVQGLQQAQDMSSRTSSLASDLGASSGTAAMAGAFGAYVVIAKMAYDEFKRHGESRRERKYEYAAVLSNYGDGWAMQGMEGQQRELTNSIRATAEAFAASIGGAIDTFAALEIKVRRDGKYFRAIVEGQLVGQFESMEEAISAGLMAVFAHAKTTIRGLSDLVREGMEQIANPERNNTEFGSLEEAQEFLSALNEISRLDWSGGARQTLDAIRHFDTLWATLERLDTITPAVVQGFENILAAELRTWQAWSDQITGRKKTPAEDLAARRAEAVLFNAQRLLRLEELKMRKLDLESQLAYLTGKAKGVAGGIGLWKVDLEAHGAYLKSKGELTQTELEIYNQSVEGLKSIIAALDGVIAAFPAAIDLDSITVPRTGGTNASKKDEVRDFLEEKRLSRLGPIAQDFARLNKEYDEQAKKAKGNADLLAKVNAERQKEIDLLAKRVRADLITPYLGPAGSAGRSGFSADERQIRDDYADLRAVARSLHIPLWQVNAAERERLRLLQLEAGAAAGSRIAQTQLEMERLAETIAYLKTRAAENADLLASIGDEQFLRLGDALFGFLDRYYKDVEGFEQFRLDLEQTRFDLEYANMVLQFEWIKGMGILTDEQISRIQGVLDYIEANPPDLSRVFANDNNRPDASRTDSRMTDLAAAVDRLREAFAKAKDGITEFLQATARGEFGGISPVMGLDAARGQFESIIAKANAGNLSAFQQAPEAAKNFIDVLKRYSPDLFQVELPRIQEMMRNLLLVNTVTDGTTTATETQEEQRRHRETVDTLSRGFGDLSGHAAAAAHIEEQVLDELRLLRTANQELNARLARLESGKVGEKRAA